MLCAWLREIPPGSSLTLLLGSTCVLLNYFRKPISSSVFSTFCGFPSDLRALEKGTRALPPQLRLRRRELMRIANHDHWIDLCRNSTNVIHKMKIFSLVPVSNFNFNEFHGRLCKSVFCWELSTKTTKLEIKMWLDSRMEKIEMQMGRSALGSERALRPLTAFLNNYKLLFISSAVYFLFQQGLDG